MLVRKGANIAKQDLGTLGVLGVWLPEARGAGS